MSVLGRDLVGLPDASELAFVPALVGVDLLDPTTVGRPDGLRVGVVAQSERREGSAYVA